MASPNPNRTGELIINLKQDFKRRLQVKLSEHQVCIRELHGRVIFYIDNNQPCRMVDIASHCRVRPQSMATAINQLEMMGYLSRQPSETDLRAKLIVLTTEGRQLTKHLDATTQEVWSDYESIVGKSDLNQMMTTMNKLFVSSTDEFDRP